MTNSERLAELRKKRKDEKSSFSTSKNKTYKNSDRLKKLRLERDIDFDTFESDLNSLGTTVPSIYNGWQPQDTLSKTKTKVEDMQRRINAYQEYQKMFGGGKGADLTDISSSYKSILDDIDNLSAHYGEYDSADAYKKALKAIEAEEKRKKDASVADINAVKTEIDDIQKILDTANSKKPKTNTLTKKGAASIEAFKQKDKEQEELDNYLKSLGYSSLDDVEKALGDKKAFLEEAKVIQENKHYTEKAKSGEGKKGYEAWLASEKAAQEKLEKEESEKSWWETALEMMGSTPDTTLPGHQIPQVVNDKMKDNSYEKPNEKWTDEARHEFGARFLENPQKAYEYAAQYNNSLALKEKNAKEKNVGDSSTSSGWGAIGNWAGARLTAPLGLVDFLDDATDIAAGRHTIVEEAELTPFEYSQAVSESQASALNEWSGTLNEKIPVIGGKGVGDAYSLGNSIIDSKVSATTLGAYGTLLNYFGQAAASGVDDAVARGASGKQALLYGAAQGLAEGIPEMISADKFLKLGKKADIGFLGKVRKQAREEGTEELVTAILSNAADNAIMQDKSQFNIDVKNLMLKGMTEEEAKENVWLSRAEEIAFDALGGYISGGLGSVGKVASITRAEKKTGANIRGNERVNEMLEVAGMTPQESDAYNLYTQYAKKGVNADNVKDVQLGRLYNTSYNDAQDTLSSKKSTNEQKVNAVKTLHRLSEVSSENTDAKRKKELNVGETTTVTSTGDTASIKGIKLGKDNTTLVTNDGEVSIDDITLSDKDADLVIKAENITKEFGEEMGNLFLTQYDGETDIDDYSTSFNLGMLYAKHNFTQDMMLENRGVLSTSQVQNIHNTMVHAQYVEHDNKLKAITEKHGKSKFIKGTFDDSIVDYNSATTDGSKVNWKDLESKQRKAIKFAQLFAKATGVNIKLIKSDVKFGKHDGKNGAYDPAKNTIEIDVYAGRIDAKSVKDSIVPTLSHEITHWMKYKASAIYDSIREDVMRTLANHERTDSKGNKIKLTETELVSREMDRIKKNHPEIDVTPEYAIDELVARACEDMLTNSNSARKLLAKMSASEQNSFIDKVKETFDNLIQWVNDLLSLYSSESEEAKILKEYKHMLKKTSKQWDSMLETAIESNQALKKEGILAEELVNGISKDGTTIVGKNNIQMSERTYAEGGRDFLSNWLDEQKGLTKKDKQDILNQTDMIAQLMKDIRENNELPDYTRWAAMDVVKDENGEKVLSVIVKNGDYAMNIDFSQVCKKRVALNAVLNAMVQSGDLNAYTLTETDVADLNAIIKKHDFEIACALCFVDSKRYRVGNWAESFCEGADKKKGKTMVHQYGFNEMVRSLIPKGSKIQVDEFNFTNREIVGQPTSNLLSEMDDSKLDFTLIDEILDREFKAGSKPTDLYAYAKAIKDNKELRKILNPAEIISSIGLDAIRLEQPNLYRLINRHQGTARPKFAHDAVAYTNDVLKASNFTKEKAKMVGGVRCQSFSDFMANMVFDYVQFISELSAKELTAHSYTKEPLFVKLFGLTGMKINMSLVPKAVQMTPEQQEYFAILNDPKANRRSAEYQKAKRDYKKLTDNAGLDEHGNYIWEDETFPYDIAMDIVVDPRYSANCGTIAVGISDNHILKLLNDDNISMVIPYHKSGLNHIVAKMRNIDLYVDYTKIQNTRFANGKKLEKVPDFDFYGDLYGVDGKKGTHNPKKTADNYLKWCDEHNYIPRFEKSRIGRKFRDNPNYYKLLIDFRVYDTDGTYREQQAVKPIYPSNEEFKDLILNGVVGKDGKIYGGLKQQQGTTDKLNAESQQIIDEYRERLKAKYGKDVLATKNSDRVTTEEEDTAYMDAYYDGDEDLMQELVDKVANRLGYKYKAYHHTENGFTVFDLNKARASMDIQGFYFSADKDAESEYGSVRYDTYLKMENPYIVDSKEKRLAIPFDMSKENAGIIAREWLQSQGYDGVIRKAEYFGAEADEYIVFNSNQIKSAEAMTFADDEYGEGDIIPLSERFNATNEDIRYSDRETFDDAAEKLATISDEEYLKERAETPFILVMENTPSIVLDTMIDDNKNSLANDRSILIRRDALYLAIRESGVQEGHYHGLGTEVIKKLPEYLEKPDVILKTDSGENKRLVLSHIDSKNGQAIISVEFESIKTFDGQKDYYNIIVTVFDLHKNYLKSLFEKHNAEIKYKNEDLEQSNPQLYEWLRIINSKSSKDSLLQEDGKSQEKLSDRDSEGNTLTKEQTEFFKDSKVRDNNGNLLVVYHGTPNGDFNTFKISDGAHNSLMAQYGAGYYFDSNKDSAKRYTQDVNKTVAKRNPKVFEAYLNIKNPLVIHDEFLDGREPVITKQQFIDVVSKGNYEWMFTNGMPFELTKYLGKTKSEIQQLPRDEIIRNWADMVYDRAYFDSEMLSAMVKAYKGDSILGVMKEVFGNDGVKVIDKYGEMWVAWDNSQIKETTNTNPTSNPDIRYSDRDNVSVYDTMGETDRLIKENEQLKEDVERLKERLKLERQITKGNHFNENQLNAVAGHIRNIAKSNYSKPELVNLLKGVYSYIATSKDLNWQDMFSQCYDIASMVLEEAKPVTTTNEYYKWILNDIRGTKISVNEQQIQNARYKLGNKWRNAFFNKVKITDNAISLDRQWQSWANSYPDLFDAEISDADQLIELYDIYDSVKESSEVVVEYDIEEQTRWLAREIYNQYWNVSPIRTTAEKYDKQIKLLNYKHREAMSQLRDNYEDRLKSQHKADRQKAIKLVKEIRDRKDNEIAEVKQKSKERMAAYKENAERKTKIQSITSKALTLNEWLLKNSKEKHIHESLKGPVANLLQAIDFSSKQLLGMRGGDYSGMPTRKDISLQKALGQVKDMMLEASVGKEELVDLYGHDLDDDIKLLVESVDNIMRTVGDNEFILNKMTLNDLNTLDNMLKTIKQAVTKMNQFHSVHHAQGIASLGQEEIRYAEKLGNEKVYVEGSLKSGTKKMLKWTNSVPYYAFKRFGEAGKKIFEAFQDGWDKMSFNVKEVIDFTQKTYKTKEVREWEKEIKSFDVLVPATDYEKSDPNYKPKTQKVQMTTAQVMYLYLLNKRASAKAHLLGGGIVVSNIETKKSELISQPEGVLLEQGEIDKIIQSLTKRQIEVANALSKFMNTVCSDWGNEISMARFGYKAFGEPDYVPMQVDKDEISTADPAEKNNSLFKLLNMSFTKGLTEGANNRLVISSIFDVFAQHTSDMAKYNALALPVLDAFKWYNYKEIEYVGEEAKVRNTVKKSIGKAFGKDGQSYITTLLEDINGQNSLSRDKMSVRFFKNAKLASVGMNLRVILLQPTSYFRASANIDNKYLIKALAHKPKIAHAEKYCGMALWKSLGYYDTNIQRGVAEQIKHAETPYDKVVEWSMKGAGEADRLTLGYLWNAAELEIRKTRKDLKVGSEEFFFEVGKRLRDIIYSTQVVDSTVTRSEFMRSPDGRDKILSMFASEPTLAYNILQDAYIQTSLDARELGGKKAAFKKNGKKIAKAITAYTVTNAVAALVESGFDALRDDDDEEMDIAEFMKLYLANFAADMSIVGKVPYLKDGLSILQGYSPSRSDLQWIESAYKTYTGITKHLEGEGNPVTTIKNSLKTFSYVSGLPFYNAYRDIMATLNKLDILSPEDIEEIFE